MKGLSLCLLGPFQVLVDGQRAALINYHKAQALLIYLAMESDRAHRRRAVPAGRLRRRRPHDSLEQRGRHLG